MRTEAPKGLARQFMSEASGERGTRYAAHDVSLSEQWNL
jgi:hypothetical protein